VHGSHSGGGHSLKSHRKARRVSLSAQALGSLKRSRSSLASLGRGALIHGTSDSLTSGQAPSKRQKSGGGPHPLVAGKGITLGPGVRRLRQAIEKKDQPKGTFWMGLRKASTLGSRGIIPSGRRRETWNPRWSRDTLTDRTCIEECLIGKRKRGTSICLTAILRGLHRPYSRRKSLPLLKMRKWN